MFDVLMGSTRRRERKLGRGIVSAFLHIVAIAGVAKATGIAPGDVPASRIVDVILHDDAAPEPARVRIPTASTGIIAAPVMEHVMAPVEVPVGIPRITLDERWNPRSVVLASGPAGIPGLPVGIGTFDFDSILAESAVDEPAAVLLQQSPRYPRALQAAGLEGRVSVRFVVGAEGRAEPGSIQSSSSTHAGFIGSARETILKTVFRPARVRGRAVRQWAEQAVVFRFNP